MHREKIKGRRGSEKEKNIKMLPCAECQIEDVPVQWGGREDRPRLGVRRLEPVLGIVLACEGALAPLRKVKGRRSRGRKGYEKKSPIDEEGEGVITLQHLTAPLYNRNHIEITGVHTWPMYIGRNQPIDPVRKAKNQYCLIETRKTGQSSPGKSTKKEIKERDLLRNYTNHKGPSRKLTNQAGGEERASRVQENVTDTESPS